MFKKIAGNKSFWEKVRNDNSYRPLIDRLYELYNDHCEGDIPSEKYSLYKLYFETGDRNTYEKTYFSKRIRMNTLAILCLIYPERNEYIEKLQDTIWAICDEYSWFLPAHAQNYPETEYDTVDLFSSETAFALSEIKYLLGDRLDNLINKRIDDEIRRKVLNPFKIKIQRWERWENNWAAVCAASVGASFMYQAPEEFSEVRERISSSINCFLNGYKDDGACLEGLAYWEYGFGFYIWYADLLEEFTCGEENLFDSEKVKNIADFAQKIYLAKNVTTSFSDSIGHGNLMVGMCHFLKERYGDKMILPPSGLKTDDHCGRWCHHIRSFVFYNSEYKDAPFNNNAEYLLPDAAWYIKRTPSYSFAIKGGNNAEPHNHNDIGSFIFAVGERQLIADLGCGEYTSDYFRPETRYSILCNCSFGHSVPIINGKAQCEGEEYKGELCLQNGSVLVDMKNAYDDEGLKKLQRKISFSENAITLSDSFEFIGEGEYVCRLVLYEEPIINDGKVFFDGLSIEYDNSKWSAFYKRDVHTLHISNEKINVYLMDFKPIKKQNNIELKIQGVKL